MEQRKFLLCLILGILSLFLWGEESFLILKPFGFASLERSISPALLLEVLKEKEIYEKPIFRRSSLGDSFLSFPQEEEWIIIPFQNFFRKEIYKKTEKGFISQDFSLFLGDIISLYLYDNYKKEWVNPLLMENLGSHASLTLRELSLESQEGKRFSLNSRYPVNVAKGDIDLLIYVSSELTGAFRGMVGFYNLSITINGKEWMTFFTQGIRVKDNQFVWEGLDPNKGSYEQGKFKLKNPPLKVGTNEIRIEVKNFLYRSLVFRGFIKVLEPLVQ